MSFLIAQRRHISQMASICRDSRRTADERALSAEVLLASPSYTRESPFAHRITEKTVNCSATSDFKQYDEKYRQNQVQQDAVLPRHSQDLANASPKCKSKRKHTTLRQIAQVALSFAVTWMILDACFGLKADPIARLLDHASSKARPISLPWRTNLAPVVPLQPLSCEAHAIKTRCKSLPPFSSAVHRERIARVRSILQDIRNDKPEKSSGDQVYVLEPGASSFYYTGIGREQWHVSERPFLFVIRSAENGRKAKNGPVLSILTPAFEAPRAKLLDLPGLDKDGEVEFVEWREEENWAEILLRHLDGSREMNDLKQEATSTLKIHFDPDVRTFISAGIARAALNANMLEGNTRVLTDVADPRVLSVRERKSPEEIEVLKCANELTLQAIKATKDAMFFGIKESQTSSLLSRYFEELGMPGGEGLVLFGENAALPHGSGTDRALREEDFALIDAGGQFRGYTSDITRTFALPGGKISETQERLWFLVKQAQEAALKAGTAGALGREVDAAARDIIKNKGKRQAEREGFTHRLGHGIGLEGHEAPYLVGSNDRPIETGNVFSDEPGVYILGEVGIRLEDCWYVTDEGEGESFTGPAKDYWTV